MIDVRQRTSTLALIGFVVVCNATGLVGASATDASFYRELVRPGWSPPGWVFGPVWTVLYTMMGVAAWLVWRRPAAPGRTRALLAFAVQLLLNAAWTPVFFGLRSMGGGFAVIVMLWLAIIMTLLLFARLSRPAAVCLLPYLAWVSFAAVLNLALWRLNPGA